MQWEGYLKPLEENAKLRKMAEMSLIHPNISMLTLRRVSAKRQIRRVILKFILRADRSDEQCWYRARYIFFFLNCLLSDRRSYLFPGKQETEIQSGLRVRRSEFRQLNGLKVEEDTIYIQSLPLNQTEALKIMEITMVFVVLCNYSSAHGDSSQV